MKIQNDIVTFDENDVSLFSESVQAALESTAGPYRTAAEVLSNAVNSVIAESGRSRVNTLLDSMRPAAEKLATLSKTDADAAIADIGDIGDIAVAPK